MTKRKTEVPTAVLFSGNRCALGKICWRGEGLSFEDFIFFLCYFLNFTVVSKLMFCVIDALASFKNI